MTFTTQFGWVATTETKKKNKSKQPKKKKTKKTTSLVSGKLMLIEFVTFSGMFSGTIFALAVVIKYTILLLLILSLSEAS